MMSDAIKAVSKFYQTEEILLKMSERAFRRKIDLFKVKELAGGLSNAVYLVEADGDRAIVKVAPSIDVDVMSHEKNILSTEADMLSVFGEKINIPAPKLIFYDDSREICPSDYLFMTFVAGKPLMTLKDKPDDKALYEIKREVGLICKQISSIRADKFGIPAMPETWVDNNCDFVKNLFDMLYIDAEKKSINVPGISKKEILSVIESQRTVLNEVNTPCYIHTDTWDGNLMIENNKMVAIIDFAAILYGDCLMNHDFHDFSENPNPAFLDGFGKNNFTENELIRISIYKLWQRLGMIVERGYRGYEDPNLYSWVFDTYINEVANLKSMICK